MELQGSFVESIRGSTLFLQKQTEWNRYATDLDFSRINNRDILCVAFNGPVGGKNRVYCRDNSAAEVSMCLEWMNSREIRLVMKENKLMQLRFNNKSNPSLSIICIELLIL